jgi:molybdopterin-guanine dinucleotide biosynthesis protein A
MGEGIVGAVLIGGQSRRMGRDKALLSWEGKALWEHMTETLGAVLPHVMLVSSEPDRHHLPGWAVVADRFSGRGPLAGLHAALDTAHGDAVFLVACDLPGVTPELVRYLAARFTAWRSSAPARAVVPVAEGRAEPLCAVYSGPCGAAAELALSADERAMHRFLERILVLRVPITVDLPFYREELFVNLNRPEDLPEEARQGLSDRRGA